MQLRTKESLSTVERATLDALTATLKSCDAHMGGSAIGKGFRLAARYPLHKRAPPALPPLLIGHGGGGGAAAAAALPRRSRCRPPAHPPTGTTRPSSRECNGPSRIRSTSSTWA